MGVGTRMHTGAKCSKTGYSMVLIFLINLWWKLAKLKTCCCFFSVSFPGVARHGTGLFWAHVDLQRLEHHRAERKGRSTESHLPCPHQVWLRPTSKEPSTWIHDFLCSTLPSPPLHLPRRPVRAGVVLGGLWETQNFAELGESIFWKVMNPVWALLITILGGVARWVIVQNSSLFKALASKVCHHGTVSTV